MLESIRGRRAHALGGLVLLVAPGHVGGSEHAMRLFIVQLRFVFALVSARFVCRGGPAMPSSMPSCSHDSQSQHTATPGSRVRGCMILLHVPAERTQRQRHTICCHLQVCLHPTAVEQTGEGLDPFYAPLPHISALVIAARHMIRNVEPLAARSVGAFKLGSG